MNKVKREDIIRKAKRKAARLKRLRKDPRYHTVMGRLVYEKLLDAPEVQAFKRKLQLEDMLWVGENIEPRVLELLPAILIKAPRIIYKESLPEDLKNIKNDLARGKAKGDFRGIPVKSCDQWIPTTGKKGKRPSVRKVFYLPNEDLNKLAKQSRKEKVSEAEIIRRALENYWE